jgi:heme/copper-type cytochrome/quinol oxidase subunit 2
VLDQLFMFHVFTAMGSARRRTDVSRPKILPALLLPLVMLLLLGASPALGADLRDGWGRWWLPPDRSLHGHRIDSLFVVTFWITMITFAAVEICLIVFLIKYRYRPDRKKAHFTHGNTRLEMAWTLAPAVILAVLAVINKGAWDDLRFSKDNDNPNRATILVIGQQFKWNVIYPGPDGKLGRYLLFPKPTDQRWPGGTKFAGVAGPAFLKYDDAIRQINNYISTVNPLGKDFDDPDGKDDDFVMQPGREINIPVNRPVEVQLGSRDVIHSFFLPNHRVKLDAVPGMRGRIVFTATMSSRQREEQSRRKYTVDELQATYQSNPGAEFTLIVSEEEKTEGAELYKPPRGASYWRYKDKENRTIVRHGATLSRDSVDKLKEAGIAEVYAFQPGYWELVCEELCGMGHFEMRGQVRVLEQDEYNQRFEGGRSLNPPATQPANVAHAQ